MRISDWSSDVCSSDLSMAYDIALTDKLSVFVDDMRRLNVRCLPPCVNRSGPDFTVEQDAEGLAVRYALGALKGVGEKAMGDLVARSEEHTSELQSLMRISYAVFCLQKITNQNLNL